MMCCIHLPLRLSSPSFHAAVTVPQNPYRLRLLLSSPSCAPLLISPFPIQKTLTLSPTSLKPLFVSLQTQASSSSPTVTTTPQHPRDQKQKHSFTIAYLINSCGLSPESAIATAQKLQLDSTDRADGVLALLRNHGFSGPQISSLVKKRPVLLLANAESILLPKLRFFLSIGISKADLARTLSSDPTLLTRSLDNQIIPSYKFLKSVLLSDEKIVAAMRRTTWVFLEDHTKNLVPNINSLSETGVPQKCIKLLLTHFPEALMQSNDEFCKIMREVKGMGFDPQKTTFVLAVHAMSGKGNKSIWDKCFEVYQSWGWSEDDIMDAFKKHPHCMMLSERKINRSMEFFVNKMGWPSRLIAHFPMVLFYSLEKRIIPRCSVIRVLLSKGLLKGGWSLTTVLLPVEKFFLDKFVTKHEDKAPELIDVYHGKVDPSDL